MKIVILKLGHLFDLINIILNLIFHICCNFIWLWLDQLNTFDLSIKVLNLLNETKIKPGTYWILLSNELNLWWFDFINIWSNCNNLVHTLSHNSHNTNAICWPFSSKNVINLIKMSVSDKVRFTKGDLWRFSFAPNDCTGSH